MKTVNLILTILFISSVACADYSIQWYTVNNGGGTSSGGTYEVSGTAGQADAGYHYESPYELMGGFWVGGPLCIVNLEDFAVFAAYWLDGPCNESNDWCGGADLNQVNDVDIEDLKILAGKWLEVCPFGWPL